MSDKVWDLLYEFDKLENIIRNSMMPNEWEIIKGINIVKEIVKEINPMEIDEEFKKFVMIGVNAYKKELQNRMIVINSYVEYGISSGLRLIDQVEYFNRINLILSCCYHLGPLNSFLF